MSKVLVLGAGGMAGHVVATYLKEHGFDVDTLSAHNALDEHTQLIDVTDKQKLKSFLKTHEYDVVINCIGLLVKQSEERKDLAAYLNAYLPHFLENYYKDTSTKVLHISTDCVFAGHNAPYKEDDAQDGDLFYGRAKALGELSNDKDLTLRMSIIGPDMKKDAPGLFNWFYSQDGEITGYSNVIWHGVTTIELAKAMVAAIEQDLTGLYHLVPKKSISKFDLLQLFKEVFERKGMTVTPVESSAIDLTLVNTRTDFDYQVPDYKTMIGEMREWIENHPKLYKHYG